jgi:hypothetical protein
MRMLAQNPGGGTISAQEFATARKNLTNLLQNPGYVPDPGLGSVAFCLGSDERNALTDFADAQGLYATGPLQAASVAAYDLFTDELDEPVTAEDNQTLHHQKRFGRRGCATTVW